LARMVWVVGISGLKGDCLAFISEGEEGEEGEDVDEEVVVVLREPEMLGLFRLSDPAPFEPEGASSSERKASDSSLADDAPPPAAAAAAALLAPRVLLSWPSWGNLWRA
jgi:hypothetical protein